MPPAPVVSHRHRSKSAPRGVSPDSKALRKAAETKSNATKKVLKDVDVYKTPPPRTSKRSGSSASKESKDSTRKRISFGDVKIQDIEAENPRPKSKVKAMNAKEADEIFESLKDMGGSGVCSVILVMFSLFTLIIGAYHMSLSP